MCFSSPKAAPTVAPEPTKVPLAKPKEAKSKEQRLAEKSAADSSKHLANQKNRNHFRIRLGSGVSLGGKKNGGSGLSL